jgi:hypothetical protein
MTEPLESAGAEVTSAPGEDMSFKSTEMLLEEMASTMMDAEIKETFLIRYDAIIQIGVESHTIDMSSLKACMDNAATLTRSPSILPNSVRITSQKVIILPEVEHLLLPADVEDAPIRKLPDEQRSVTMSDPYIPKV